MTGEEHGRVKKAAIQIIERLCSLKSTCMTVVESKGLCSLVQQLACKDISIRLRTARVLQSVAQHDLPDGYFGDEVCCLLGLHMAKRSTRHVTISTFLI